MNENLKDSVVYKLTTVDQLSMSLFILRWPVLKLLLLEVTFLFSVE